ncbi:MAG: helix-turn-helix transcriptional regulator [Treponema sp.]|nr:helix-turn-helix transcriptional regulator [Treponema sp.]
MFSVYSTLKRFLQTRDELSIRNIRRDLWPLFLIFPLSVILGDFRYFNLHIEFAGLQSYELMLYPLGLGWLVLAFVPKRVILPLLQIAAICCAALLPFQLLLTDEMPKLAAFLGFQFLNGICAGCAFSFFCFKLNNVERLFGMALILFYYSLYYTIYRAYPAVQVVYKLYAGIVVMAFYLVLVFFLSRIAKKPEFESGEITETAELSNGKGSIVKIVIGLHIIYYSIMCMINYIESVENIIFSMPYGLGQLSSIMMIVLIMLVSNRNSLYIWLMFLVFSLLGLTIVGYNSDAARFSGSLIYGFGDGLGYIIIYYLCSGAIKKSGSIKMYRLFCLILFFEYFFVSGILSQAFDRYDGSKHAIALSIVVVLSSCCFLILPYLQKKLFEADWTDGLHLKDMVEYTQGLADTDVININEHLDLTEREHEVFTMLLKGMAPKEIAFTLKVSYPTVNFHIANLYRKLGIRSRAELFAKYKK